jgi:hypothetical protein
MIEAAKKGETKDASSKDSVANKEMPKMPQFVNVSFQRT